MKSLLHKIQCVDSFSKPNALHFMKIILGPIFDYIADIGASRLNCPLFQYFK